MKVPPNIPIYEFIKQELRKRIESGDLKVGARVPSEFELARDYGVSRNPTRQALRDLELEGYLVRLPGRGSFVASIEKWQRLCFKQEWRTVCFTCPSLGSLHWRTALRGFIDYAAERNVHVMVHVQRAALQQDLPFLAELKNSGVKGVALALPHLDGLAVGLLSTFHESAFPFVLMDDYLRGTSFDFVTNDYRDLGYCLTKALVMKGHQNIALMISEAESAAGEDLRAGYARALEEAHIPFYSELTSSVESGDGKVQELTRILAFCRRPSAVLCSDAASAAIMLQQLPALGYRVPEDVEIAVIDDDGLVQRVDVPLISGQRVALMLGRDSAQTLMERIGNQDLPPLQHFLKGRVQVTGDLPEKKARVPHVVE